MNIISAYKNRNESRRRRKLVGKRDVSTRRWTKHSIMPKVAIWNAMTPCPGKWIWFFENSSKNDLFLQMFWLHHLNFRHHWRTRNRQFLRRNNENKVKNIFVYMMYVQILHSSTFLFCIHMRQRIYDAVALLSISTHVKCLLTTKQKLCLFLQWKLCLFLSALEYQMCRFSIFN